MEWSLAECCIDYFGQRPMIQFSVKLYHKEARALYELAERNHRDIRRQIHWVIVTELIRLGYLPTDWLDKPLHERANYDD
jgi:hypothetical protein